MLPAQNRGALCRPEGVHAASADPHIKFVTLKLRGGTVPAIRSGDWSLLLQSSGKRVGWLICDCVQVDESIVHDDSGYYRSSKEPEWH